MIIDLMAQDPLVTAVGHHTEVILVMALKDQRDQTPEEAVIVPEANDQHNLVVTYVETVSTSLAEDQTINKIF